MAHHLGGGKFRTNKYKTKFMAVNSHGRTLFVKLEFAQKFVIFGQNCAMHWNINYVIDPPKRATSTFRGINYVIHTPVLAIKSAHKNNRFT